MSASDSAPQLVFPPNSEKPEFWWGYPTDAHEFASQVDEGMLYRYRLRHPSKRQPKDSYQGIDRKSVV